MPLEGLKKVEICLKGNDVLKHNLKGIQIKVLKDSKKSIKKPMKRNENPFEKMEKKMKR